MYNGLIQPKSKDVIERLKIHKEELVKLLNKYDPQYVCYEELNYSRNVKTIKTLFCFIGVTILTAFEYNSIKAKGIEATHVRKSILGPKYGGAKKIEIQTFVCKLFKLAPFDKIAFYEQEIETCKLQLEKRSQIYKKKMEKLSKQFDKELIKGDVCDAIALGYSYCQYLKGELSYE